MGVPVNNSMDAIGVGNDIFGCPDAFYALISKVGNKNDIISPCCCGGVNRLLDLAV